MSGVRDLYRAVRSHDRLVARRIERGADLEERDRGLDMSEARRLAAALRSGDASVALSNLVREQEWREREGS
jgi:hypothetical protein